MLFTYFRLVLTKLLGQSSYPDIPHLPITAVPPIGAIRPSSQSIDVEGLEAGKDAAPGLVTPSQV